MRTVASYLVLMPGVTTGAGNNAYDARINGGMVTGDEAIMDGASMQEGFMSQSGMVSFYDFRMTPDMVGEFQVKTSTYEPEYGASTGGQIIATSKSGTAQFHGAAYEYLRNKDLNATQWQIDRPPGDIRPKDNENNFGFAIGGPVKIPKIYNTDKARTFFFFDYEGFRIVGGANAPTYTLPTEKMRNGDFSEWPQPIYDPTTTRLNPNFNASAGVSASNPQYLRDAFPGNVIPANRITNSLAQGFYKYLPEPNKPGINSNWTSPDSGSRQHPRQLERVDPQDRPVRRHQGPHLRHGLAAEEPGQVQLGLSGPDRELRPSLIPRTPGWTGPTGTTRSARPC